MYKLAAAYNLDIFDILSNPPFLVMILDKLSSIPEVILSNSSLLVI